MAAVSFLLAAFHLIMTRMSPSMTLRCSSASLPGCTKERQTHVRNGGREGIRAWREAWGGGRGQSTCTKETMTPPSRSSSETPKSPWAPRSSRTSRSIGLFFALDAARRACQAKAKHARRQTPRMSTRRMHAVHEGPGHACSERLSVVQPLSTRRWPEGEERRGYDHLLLGALLGHLLAAQVLGRRDDVLEVVVRAGAVELVAVGLPPNLLAERLVLRRGGRGARGTEVRDGEEGGGRRMAQGA